MTHLKCTCTEEPFSSVIDLNKTVVINRPQAEYSIPEVEAATLYVLASVSKNTLFVYPYNTGTSVYLIKILSALDRAQASFREHVVVATNTATRFEGHSFTLLIHRCS